MPWSLFKLPINAVGTLSLPRPKDQFSLLVAKRSLNDSSDNFDSIVHPDNIVKNIPSSSDELRNWIFIIILLVIKGLTCNLSLTFLVRLSILRIFSATAVSQHVADGVCLDSLPSAALA